MAAFSRLLACALVAAACRELPSRIPLADSGEFRPEDEGALDRNRVPFTARTARPERRESGEARDAGVVKPVETAANVPDAGDAGVPEAGVVGGDAGAGELRWAGEYFGTDRHVTRIGSNPEEVVTDDKAHTRVETPSPGVIAISLVSSADGTVICTMKARVNGARAELENGEHCAGLMMMPPLETHGSASLDGETLEVSLDASGSFPAGDETQDVVVEYEFEGKRR